MGRSCLPIWMGFLRHRLGTGVCVLTAIDFNVENLRLANVHRSGSGFNELARFATTFGRRLSAVRHFDEANGSTRFSSV